MQWKRFVNQGLLKSIPATSFQPLKGYTGSAKDHAKSYLHVHCGSCHNSNGGAGRGEFSFDVKDQISDKELCNLKTQSSGSNQNIGPFIQPTNPTKSELYVRASSKNPKLRMPPLATSLNSDKHLKALEQWISSIDCD